MPLMPCFKFKFNKIPILHLEAETPFGLVFASSPWKLVTNYILEWMGLNFYDYDGLQPKITPPKHFSRQCSLQPTVVHSTKRGRYIKYMTWCHLLAVHVKRLLSVHTVGHKRDYWWKFCGLSVIINFTRKKHKIWNIRYFEVSWNCIKLLHIYLTQQHIVFID